MREGILFISAFLMTVIAIPLLRRFSYHIGFLDRPDGDSLKIHGLPTPHSGGVAMFSVFSILLLILFLTGGVGGFNTFGVLVGGSLVFALGIWDDLKYAHPFVRIGGQVLAGLVLILFDTTIESSFLLLSLFLTIFYVVGAINAMNMQDGLDGLAGGMALLSFAGFCLLSTLKAQPLGLIISSVMAGVLLGFLFYNFNPSSIFMGDNGSYFLGFVLACLAVKFTSLDHLSTFFGPILIIGAPVPEAAYTILRRLRRRGSPFAGDRSHFYDQLVQKGFTVRQAVLICWTIQVLLVGTGLWIYSL
jgi:UDP-GlcNAc:undecaprenyl-phosphate GlcNAc-1-phosphate transferase